MFQNIVSHGVSLECKLIPSFPHHKIHQAETEIKWVPRHLSRVQCWTCIVMKLIIHNSNNGYGYNRNNQLTCWRRLAVEFARNLWKTIITITWRSERLDTYKGKFHISCFPEKPERQRISAFEEEGWAFVVFCFYKQVLVFLVSTRAQTLLILMYFKCFYFNVHQQ